MSKHEFLVHEITINAPISRVHSALTTKEGLQGWNTKHATGSGLLGSEWVFEYKGKPSFSWKIVSLEPNRVAWTCTAGPGDSVGTTAEYVLSAKADGRTLVEFKHDGWPSTDGNFRKCNTLWGVLLHHLAKYVETGTVNPAHE